MISRGLFASIVSLAHLAIVVDGPAGFPGVCLPEGRRQKPLPMTSISLPTASPGRRRLACRGRWFLLALAALLFAAPDLRAAVIISEFMADNSAGLQDENGDFSDWIELHNDGAVAVNLAGWALSDDAGDDDKWEFPAVSIGPGQFLVVFASGKDRKVVGQNLHTNFNLASGGEYLALRQPGGAVATEFDGYPEQFENKSYGIGQNVQVTQLVAADAPARAHIPTSGTPATWNQAGFDHSTWTAGTNGVGFETTVPGFAVANYRASITVNNLTDAESVIATPANRFATFRENKAVVNYLNTGDGAHHLGDSTFPGLTINVDADDFVLEATGTVTIPAAGQWTFGVNSDDGFILAVGAFNVSYPSPRGPGDTLGTFNFPAAGEYPIRLVFYERGGGSEVELFAAQGVHGGWNSNFRLVGDTPNGGLAVKSIPVSSGGGYRPLIGTDVQTQMLNVNASAYVRIPFTVANVNDLTSLTLRAKYDDGFVAYVNGFKVAERNAPVSPVWNSPATGPHANTAAVVYENIDASPALGVLQNGANNVLAIHAMNTSAADGDFLILADLAEYETIGTTNHYFSTPTPGAVNSSNHYAVAEAVTFSEARGFFDAPFSVGLETATPGATIRYTTDGSAPTATTGTVYGGPISITGTTTLRARAFKTDFEPSSVGTQTYLFLDQVLQQPVLPAGFPAQWGAGVNADYEMDPAVVANAAYSGVIKDAFKSIPSVSIVMDLNDLFGPSGIYSNPTGEGVAWERACSVEWLDPTGNGDEFQINCGVRPQGGASRNPGNSPKHGFRFLFKDIWGPSKLKFRMFKDSPVDEFDTVTFHARFNDAWIWNGASAQYIRDMWCRDAQRDMGRPTPHGTYVHLYVNGIYWGMYDPGEKPDASFAAQHFGGDKSEYDAVNSNEFIDGDGTAWNTMFTIARSGLANDATYAQLKQYLDVPGFIDYMIINFYAGNTDWPSHNWTAARRRAAGAGYQFFSWDAEWTFSSNNIDVTGANNGNTPGELFQLLRLNAEFRQLFGDHVHRHFFNGGVMMPAASEARWMARATEIDQAIICESARWGDYRVEPPRTRNVDWLGEQSRLRTQFFPQRSGIMVNQFRGISLYPASEAPAFSQHGGSVPVGYALSMTHANATGSILYTTDGTDPRLPGGGLAPSAQTYAAPLVLNAHAVIRARVRDGTAWSALNEATFYTQQDFSPLAITEIMFNPIGGDDFEFIEFKNRGANALDLSGLTFDSGLTFTFPGGSLLAPGAFFVIARNPAQFATRYPGVTVRGTFTGNLSNGGEQLSVAHALGTPIFSLTYGDHAPWPVAADGNGFSLVPLNFTDPSNAANWRASANINGSPGADDPAVSIPRVLVNEVLTNGAGVDFIELHNPNAAAVNIGGWFLSDDPGTPKKYAIPAGTTIPAGGYVVFTEAHFNPFPGVGNNFNLGADGDEVYLCSGSGGNLTGYSHGFQYGAAAPNVTFGRHVNSVGDEQFPAQISSTSSAVNSGPRVGPVVINEIQYHPEPGYDEFIELKNITASPVQLFDPSVPANTWRLGGLNYSLPAGLSIPADGYLLLVGIEPAVFRAKYGVPAAVPIVGPYPGVLQDSGERLQLQRPGVPATSVPYITVDEVRYNDKAPWPTAADGLGPSLQRTTSTVYANDPANWFASGPTPGSVNVVNQSPTVTLTAPASGTSVPAVATIVIEATASDSDGTISKVEFYNGATKLGEATAPPYRYTWSNVPEGTYPLTAKARDNRLATTVSEPAIVSVTAPPPGNGIGLRGEYYDNVVNFSALGGATPILTRTDASLQFDWGSGSPHATMGADTFSVRWTGQVQPRITGNFAFYTYSDDGVRLWVNNQLIVDNWTDHAPTENAGTIDLIAGQLYDIRMEFFESGGGALAMLSWSAPGLSKEFIPPSQLFPAGAPRIATQPQSQTVSAGGNVTFTTLASGTGPITYQWYRGATPVGTNSPTLNLVGVNAGHAGNYTVTATNTSGMATSSIAVLTVTNIDSDSDGIPDAWETANGFNPNNGADALLDADKDGQSNLAEYLAGTGPNDAMSLFKAETFRDAGGNPVVRFTAVAAKTYTVQWRPDLAAGTWTKLADVPSGSTRTVDTTDLGAGSATSRVYRVVTPVQP